MGTSLKRALYFFLTKLFRKLHQVVKYEYIRLDYSALEKKYSLKERQYKKVLSSEQRAEYTSKWGRLIQSVNMNLLNNYIDYKGRFASDVMPMEVFHLVVEPLLNNVEYARSLEDKCRVDWINGQQHVPTIYLRNIQGVYYDSNQQVVDKDKIDLELLLSRCSKVILKKSIGLHGGKGVMRLSQNEDGHFVDVHKRQLSINYMENLFGQDFLLQKFLENHEYYKNIEDGGFEVFRVVTYRSVKDNKVHVLYSFYRIGSMKEENKIEGGELSLYVNKDGYFYDYAIGVNAGKMYALKDGKQFKDYARAQQIDEVWNLAKEVAEKQIYCRILGLDIGVDADGNVVLIEVNTSEIGIDGDQLVVGPFFGDFTDEVIDYCEQQLEKQSKYNLLDL
ncbi:sugar-transfer associated ATP-grasp domain-containing protein [Carboxylicivirga sp. M1479]|uniref:sugar-transfer associated ATP-grasp domain-containing protein n=1 Tax=Carboxylicivirga sp. M1479 TaxID=2594476 RepID=UPI00163DBB1C|nr:sugar-transfer associated ATP-grasp domain-containing protein [Carboxylicivirga sp. M1479]